MKLPKTFRWLRDGFPPQIEGGVGIEIARGSMRTCSRADQLSFYTSAFTFNNATPAFNSANELRLRPRGGRLGSLCVRFP